MSRVSYILYYSDGNKVYKTFPSDQNALWYIHMEGDHLVKYTKEV